MNDARRLQKICEKQAALTESERTKVVLQQMAEEYRSQADRAGEKEPLSEKLDMGWSLCTS